MTYVLTLLVLFFAVGILFSQEITRLLQRFFAIQGMKLFVPLLLGSFLVEIGFDWIVYFLYWMQFNIHEWMSVLSSKLPFQSLVLKGLKILMLFVLACFPMIIFKGVNNRKLTPSTTKLPVLLGYLVMLLFSFLVVTIY